MRHESHLWGPVVVFIQSMVKLAYEKFVYDLRSYDDWRKLETY